MLEALNGAVVQVDIAHAGDLRVNRLAYNGIAVVLRGDVGAVRVDVLYRMVDTAVAVLQLGGLCVDSQCQQLVTEAENKEDVPAQDSDEEASAENDSDEEAEQEDELEIKEVKED